MALVQRLRPRIGPKVGLAVCSSGTPIQLRERVAKGDVNWLASLPGIGKKSAERLTYHILRIHRNEALALP